MACLWGIFVAVFRRWNQWLDEYKRWSTVFWDVMLGCWLRTNANHGASASDAAASVMFLFKQWLSRPTFTSPWHPKQQWETTRPWLHLKSSWLEPRCCGQLLSVSQVCRRTWRATGQTGNSRKAAHMEDDFKTDNIKSWPLRDGLEQIEALIESRAEGA